VTHHLPNKFAEWDQDRLRILWMAGIPQYLRKEKERENDPARPTSPEVIFAVAKHLSEMPDTRGGICRALKIGEKTADRALGSLRDEGRLIKTYNSTLKLWFYRVVEKQE
jgi:hypothetical protein